MQIKVRDTINRFRQRRRWRCLRERGMVIGQGVNLPLSTWIDVSHCYTISIGDNCGFGDQCVILAHDAMMNEFLDATKVGRVRIHESCHFGMRVVIHPGVEIGPRSIVGSNSVVINDIPPETVAAGNPARVICTLEEYLDKHRERIKTSPSFPYKEYGSLHITPEKIAQLQNDLDHTIGYILGGYTALRKGECIYRTR